MEKINFVNDTTPALNATNLNKLQQNVEDDIGDLTELETSAKNNLVEAINEAASTGGNINVYNEYTISETDTYSCNYVNGLETYSTSETRVGTWIDNKPIYRIVKNFESLSSRTNNSAPINVTSLNVDTFTDIKGVVTDKRAMLLGDSQAITWNADKTSIVIYFNNSGADTYRGYVIIEYTKTTDV